MRSGLYGEELLAVRAGQVDPPFCKMGTFFLRSLALSVSIIEISKQMELNGEVTNLEKKLYIQRHSAPFDWHTKSQKPNKKCTHFTREDPPLSCPHCL